MNDQERALRGRTPSGRLFALDALRGLGAATVVLHHLHFAFEGGYDSRWYVQPLIAGHEAVILFFVLSGYVLSLPSWRGKQLPYPLYLTRRITRIYLPYLAALVLAVVMGRNFVGSRLPLDPWFYNTWHDRMTWEVIGSGLRMAHDYRLNTAFWSLGYEMQMSLIFPALCWLIGRMRSAGSLLLIAALALVSEVVSRRHIQIGHFADTIHYSIFFIAGALLARNQDAVAVAWKRSGRVLQLVGAGVAVGLYYRLFGVFNGPHANRVGLGPGALPVRADLLVGAGAIGLIVLATCSRRTKDFLDRPLFEYLGRVSYSMYLVHGTVLYTLLNLFVGKLSRALIAVLYLLATVALSHLFLVVVEEPSLRLGKRVTGKSRAADTMQESRLKLR